MLAPAQGAELCAICLNEVKDGLCLACGHCFCRGCLKQCAINKLQRCPECRREHILDPDELGTRLESYRHVYRAWREGQPAKPIAQDIAVYVSCPRDNWAHKLPLLACDNVGLLC